MQDGPNPKEKKTTYTRSFLLSFKDLPECQEPPQSLVEFKNTLESSQQNSPDSEDREGKNRYKRQHG